MMQEALGKLRVILQLACKIDAQYQKLPLQAVDDAHRKKNRKWKLLQPYLPYVGWGLLTLVTIVLAYREYRLSNVSQSLQTAVQELKVLQTQQTQLQVCDGRAACCPVSDTHHVCLCITEWCPCSKYDVNQ